MALDGKTRGEFDEDEDLEALRWAALQTLKQNVTAASDPQEIKPGNKFISKEISHSGLRVRHTRNDGYHRHRINSNLITIVPTEQNLTISHTSVPASGNNLQSSGNEFLRRVFSGGCNAESNQDIDRQVSTKFTRFHDSSEESSSEESEEESSSSEDLDIKDNAEPDPDILQMKDEDENSLDRLMDQLEQEMNNDCDIGIKGLCLDGNSDLVNVNSGETRKVLKSPKDTKKNSRKDVSKRSGNNVMKKKMRRNTEKEICQSGVSKYHNVCDMPSVSNNALSQPLSLASVHSSRDRRLDVIVEKSSVFCNPVSSLPVPSKSPSANIYDRELRSPHRNSKFVMLKGRKSRSKSPVPKHYFPARSFCSKSPRRSKSPYNLISSFHSKSLRHTHSPRPKSPLYDRLPRCSRSPPLSRSSPHSRSLNRSISPHNSRIFYRSRSPIRSRSPVRSRSLIRSRSPCRSRSPGRLSSRSPVPPRSPRSPLISQSPGKTSRSPRRRYPSPIRYNSNHSYGRSHGSFSPRRQSRSPRSRPPNSPRQSISLKRSMSPRRSPRQSMSPNSRRMSPRRSPVAAQRQFSPRRRSLSPRFRQVSKSPIHRRPYSPRNRKSASPRRLSPSISRKHFSPLLRRNDSPIHRSPQRSLSPLRRQPSCSASRSPRRHSPVRNRSPGFSRTHVRSPSPRKRSPKSPIGRSIERHSPLLSCKLLPWLSPRQQDVVIRVSPSKHIRSTSPGCKRKSLSPYRKQMSGSNSPSVKLHERLTSRNRISKMPQSPRRGGLSKSVRETKNASHVRSHSPRSPLETRSSRNSRLPSPSIQRKSFSRTPSLSLSPSPERKSVDNSHCMKSSSCTNLKTNPSFVSPSTDKSRHQKILASATLDCQDTVSRKHTRGSIILKDSRGKVQKRIHNKGKDLVIHIAVPADKSNHRNRAVSSETSYALSDNNIELQKHDISNVSVLEARRRKFESSEPVESSNKRIRLKPVKPQETRELPKNENDEIDIMLDLELEKDINFWSGEESSSDNESRFKLLDINRTPFDTDKVSTRIRNDKLLIGQVSDKRSKRGTGRLFKGCKFTTTSSESSASMKRSREQIPSDLHDKTVDAIAPELPVHLEVQNSSESKTKDGSGVEIEDEKKCTEKSLDHMRSREGDLRAELSRRRAERLTKIGSLHEIHPSRLVRSAFKDAVGTNNMKKLDKTLKQNNTKKFESSKGNEKGDGRRVLVLKSAAVERRIPSFSVTFPKDIKHKESTTHLPKLPVRMRLGLPNITGNDRESISRRRGSQKVKLKRSVTVTSGSSSGDKV